MKIKLICFTKNGTQTCERIMACLREQECVGYQKGNFSGSKQLQKLSGSLKDWTQEAFGSQDALIFVGASGIAVRAIAPFVKSKTTDPACIVVDEQGTYVIPFLSGHIGGANELAREIAAGIKAIPVITTATDLNGLFAVDEWARANGLVISHMKLAKQVSASLLEGKKIGFFSQFSIKGSLPKGFAARKILETNLEISIRKKPCNGNTLQLIPRCVVLGIGCRKGISRESIEAAVNQVLEDFDLSKQSVREIASIDLKEQEQGILQFCQAWGLPFRVFTAQQLASVKGTFTPSSFVSSVTGVDNVCERAASLGTRGGRMLVKKQAKNGVTVAAAMEELEFSFA